MILVDLTIDGCLSFLVLVLDDGFVHNGRGNLFVDGGVMMTSFGPGQWLSVTNLRRGKTCVAD